jgi:hypothetical protein
MLAATSGGPVMSDTTVEIKHRQDLRNASRYAFLFPALVLLLMANPFLKDDDFGRICTELSFVTVLLGSLVAIRQNRAVFFTAVLFTLPIVLSPEWGLFEHARITEIATLVCFIVVVCICASAITVDVYRAKTVTLGTLLGACSVYLLLGILFSLIYNLVDVLDPLAFNFAGEHPAATGERSQLLYFSYVTLTTLGYGDVTPLSEGARMLTALQAVLGQLFVAIMVARLVALQTARVALGLDD